MLLSIRLLMLSGPLALEICRSCITFETSSSLKIMLSSELLVKGVITGSCGRTCGKVDLLIKCSFSKIRFGFVIRIGVFTIYNSWDVHFYLCAIKSFDKTVILFGSCLRNFLVAHKFYYCSLFSQSFS